ncbi:MAG: HetZ-related protein 2 [Thainema sp.]
MVSAEDIEKDWHSRIQDDYPALDDATRTSIVKWLLGDDPDRFNAFEEHELDIANRAMDYRYRILQQRYLGVSADQAYCHLIQRLSSLFLIRNKIRTWIALSRDRQRTVRDVLQEVIQEMLLRDKNLREQVAWIRQCTPSSQLRNVLMLASTEEYCLRPIRNQPLLVYRFVNYLRRSQQGGMTQVPSEELIRLVSDEIGTDESDSTISLIDNQAISGYQEQEFLEEQQVVRAEVKQSFADYLRDKLDETAVQWLELHLQGYSQDVIAQRMNLPVNDVYRLREKISYHAVRVFSLKHRPELVMGWLGTALKENNLGLTPDQWEKFQADLTPEQAFILDKLRAGQDFDAIAKALNKRVNQITSEWSKLYLAAQTLRNAGA